jgi:glycosyltransferase involved in cell wall biosynthesis
MRIAIIAGEYEPLQGGLGDFSRELARALAMQGHAVNVLTRAAAGAAPLEITNGVTVHRVGPGWGWQTWAHARRFVREHQAEVLNLQYQAAAYAMHPAINLLPRALKRTVPVVVTFHDLRVPYLFPKAGPLRYRAVLELARSAAAAIVTNAEDEAALMREQLSNVRCVPIGSNVAPADLSGFDVAAWRRARGIAPEVQLIGYFGFMNESKGGETLVRALAELRAPGRGLNVAVLQIGGQTGASDPTNTAYAARLKQLAVQLNVSQHIYATGFVEARGVSEAFANCACMALPYRDGVSFRRGTLMAALAHGQAIVTTRPRVTMPQVRDGENMRLIAPDDATALADTIALLLADADLRQRLQAGALTLSKQFGWDVIAAQTRAVFEQARQWSHVHSTL